MGVTSVLWLDDGLVVTLGERRPQRPSIATHGMPVVLRLPAIGWVALQGALGTVRGNHVRARRSKWPDRVKEIDQNFVVAL